MCCVCVQLIPSVATRHAVWRWWNFVVFCSSVCDTLVVVYSTVLLCPSMAPLEVVYLSSLDLLLEQCSCCLAIPLVGISSLSLSRCSCCVRSFLSVVVDRCAVCQTTVVFNVPACYLGRVEETVALVRHFCVPPLLMYCSPLLLLAFIRCRVCLCRASAGVGFSMIGAVAVRCAFGVGRFACGVASLSNPGDGISSLSLTRCCYVPLIPFVVAHLDLVLNDVLTIMYVLIACNCLGT